MLGSETETRLLQGIQYFRVLYTNDTSKMKIETILVNVNIQERRTKGKNVVRLLEIQYRW